MSYYPILTAALKLVKEALSEFLRLLYRISN